MDQAQAEREASHEGSRGDVHPNDNIPTERRRDDRGQQHGPSEREEDPWVEEMDAARWLQGDEPSPLHKEGHTSIGEAHRGFCGR